MPRFPLFLPFDETYLSDAGTVMQSCTSFATTFAVFLTVNEITTLDFGAVDDGLALPVILSFAIEPFGVVTRTVASAVLLARTLAQPL